MLGDEILKFHRSKSSSINRRAQLKTRYIKCISARSEAKFKLRAKLKRGLDRLRALDLGFKIVKFSAGIRKTLRLPDFCSAEAKPVFVALHIFDLRILAFATNLDHLMRHLVHFGLAAMRNAWLWLLRIGAAAYKQRRAGE